MECVKVVEFVSRVEAEPDLIPIEMNVDKQLFIIGNSRGDTFAVGVDTVESKEVQDLIDILLGKREPAVLYHISRVCGYYSRVQNWNPSKVGELKDRQAGNYSM